MLDRGVYAYPDELRHLNSVRAASNLLDGRFTAACHDLSTTDARPGDAAVQLLPAMAQRLIAGKPAALELGSRWVLIPVLFQLAVSLGLVALIHALALVFLDRRWELAALGAGVYALLGNSNAYIRHILPYDTSLLVFLAALWVAVSPRHGKGVRAALSCGLLAGFGFTIYPGYYLFPAIVFGALVVREWDPTSGGARATEQARLFACVVTGAAVAPALFEIVARIGGRSYFVDLGALSETINQGSFEEGFSFLFKYLFQLESPVGPLLLVLAAVGFLRRGISPRDATGRIDPLVVTAALAALCFAYYAFSSAVLHKTVLYGRLVHMYVPFIVWCALAAIAGARSRILRNSLSAALAVASVVAFILFARGFYPLAYPVDVIRMQTDRISTYAVQRVELVQESTSDRRYGEFTAEVRTIASSGPEMTGDRLVMLNFGFFYPVLPGDYTPYRPGPNARTLFDAPHWLIHPVYTFEGNTIEERRLLDERAYRIKIFSEAPP